MSKLGQMTNRKLFLSVWLWVKVRIRSSTSRECFVLLNERERMASHRSRVRCLSELRVRAGAMPFIICRGYVEGVKNIRLVTTVLVQGKKKPKTNN